MKFIYKIENGIAKTGFSRNTIPEGYVEYDPEMPPKELQDIFDANDLLEKSKKQVADAKAYLASTDWYYARKMETGKEVPAEVVANRIAAREYLNLGVTNE